MSGLRPRRSRTMSFTVWRVTPRRSAQDFIDFIHANIPEGYFKTDVEAYINS